MSSRILSLAGAGLMLWAAGLACGISAPSGVQATLERVSSQAAGTAASILTEAGTAQVMATEISGTAVAGALQTLQAQTTAMANGSISGAILYSPGIPLTTMRIYWHEKVSGRVGFVETADGQDAYTIPDLPPGVYNVMAWFWPQGAAGAVTDTGIVLASTSAEQNQCQAGLLDIPLAPGQAHTGANIGCWGGDFFYLATPSAP